MGASRRRPGRSPARRSDDEEFAAIQEELHHHGALKHSPKTVRHYRDTSRSFDHLLAGKGYAPTTALMTTPMMNAFALWLRFTPTRDWREDTQRTEAGIRGTMIDLRAFTRWALEEGPIAALLEVPVNMLPQVFLPTLSGEELDTVFAIRQLSSSTEIGVRNRALIAFMLDTGVRRAEVANPELKDPDLAEGQARILGQGRKKRFVFFARPTADLLKSGSPSAVTSPAPCSGCPSRG